MISELGKAFLEGIVEGVRPLIPAIRLLLASLFVSMAMILLGIVLIMSTTPGALSFLRIAGEGLMLVGGVMMVIGCLRAWWQIFVLAGFIGGKASVIIDDSKRGSSIADLDLGNIKDHGSQQGNKSGDAWGNRGFRNEQTGCNDPGDHQG